MSSCAAAAAAAATAATRARLACARLAGPACAATSGDDLRAALTAVGRRVGARRTALQQQQRQSKRPRSVYATGHEHLRRLSAAYTVYSPPSRVAPAPLHDARPAV